MNIKKSLPERSLVSKLIVGLLAFFLAFTALPPISAASQDKGHTGFFDLYKNNREQQIPNFITADFLLLSYSLIRQASTVEFEDTVFIPKFTEWVESLDQAIPEDKSPISIANKRLSNVILALLNGASESKDNSIDSEIKQVIKASGISRSALLQRNLDYGQFKPTGRHNKTLEGQQFFRAFRYASSVLFPLLDSKATTVSKEAANTLYLQAQQIANLYRINASLAQSYADLTYILSERFGQADDLSWDLIETISTTENEKITAHRQSLFKHIKNTTKQPTVISEIVDKSALEPKRSVADVVTGWRLLPVFATPVSSAFQQLIFDHTQAYNGDSDANPFTRGMVSGKMVKAFPRALEILALLGQDQAFSTLQASGDTAYEGYPMAYTAARNSIAAATGLPRNYLVSMQILASKTNREQSALGFWTWQRYLDQLYIKQSTTPTGKGLITNLPRPGATLESAPQIYKLLIQMVMTENRINPSDKWNAFADVLSNIQTLQWKQSIGSGFSEHDEHFLNELDLELLSLSGGPDYPVAVAIHTNPASKERLWEATGLVKEVKQDQAIGGLFSHHEFKLPMDQSLEADSWMNMLRDGGV